MERQRGILRGSWGPQSHLLLCGVGTVPSRGLCRRPSAHLSRMPWARAELCPAAAPWPLWAHFPWPTFPGLGCPQRTLPNPKSQQGPLDKGVPGAGLGKVEGGRAQDKRVPGNRELTEDRPPVSACRRYTREGRPVGLRDPDLLHIPPPLSLPIPKAPAAGTTHGESGEIVGTGERTAE